MIVAIDTKIVENLGIEESTLFEQEITNEGILMRIRTTMGPSRI